MPNYREEEITNIQELVDLIDREKTDAENSDNDSDLLFRGQPRDLVLKSFLTVVRDCLYRISGDYLNSSELVGIVLDEGIRSVTRIAKSRWLSLVIGMIRSGNVKQYRAHDRSDW